MGLSALFEADRKWCSVCAKVKMLLLKAKLDVVTVSRDHLLSLMNISDLSGDTWVTIIWESQKKSEWENMGIAKRLDSVIFSFLLLLMNQ